MYRQQRLGAHITRSVMLLCTYLLVAAAAVCGNYAKHSFGDGNTGTSLTEIMDGTAERPYVYRQLLPTIANTAERLLPQPLKTRFLEHLAQDAPAHNPLRATFTRAKSTDDPAYALRYYVVYGLSFCSLLVAMLMLRQVCLDLAGDEVAATLAPLVLAIVMPATYFYDFPELMFMATAVWLACRAKIAWLVALTLVATFNKESFPVFAVTLYPFLRLRASRRAAVACIGVCIAAGALVNALVKYRYAGNAGDPALFNLWLNLRFYANPRNYFLTEWTYGIPLPRPTNIVILGLLALLVSTGWSALPKCARRHALLAAACNVPLFLALGYVDEVRALSMLDVSAALLLCTTASVFLAGAGSRRQTGAAGARGSFAVTGGAPPGRPAEAVNDI
ncbi:hypothetical protein [Paraburkholderia unamae]|uniref:DUF2029 domain-containing protein n=1 Tax=Paraburkholderia unamae TaxID=219649 RepID=A0ABX5KK63_9BURK|nr:hypothetical protein [Paraburkholderia unamae]PVX82249.1 hypothetical protein C7402_109102 [Paraburkholderia unamae]CAG9272223.1 conserved membrane hypothetical protein [Paraburkholderia unamae]